MKWYEPGPWEQVVVGFTGKIRVNYVVSLSLIISALRVLRYGWVEMVWT